MLGCVAAMPTGLQVVYWALFIWGKVIKNGPSIICGREPLKNLKVYDVFKADHAYPFNFFKDCLLQILFGPFLNTLFHLSFPLTHFWSLLPLYTL